MTGESYRAHRVVLAASSVHFQELFEQCSGAQNLVVILDGTTPVNLRALLEFMYKGEVYVDDANLNTFLQTAKRLQVNFMAIIAQFLLYKLEYVFRKNGLREKQLYDKFVFKTF